MADSPASSPARTISGFIHVLLFLTTICAVGLFCVAILSQAVRTSSQQSWESNYNAVTIGAAYVIVVVTSLILCVKRRIAVRTKLQGISKVYHGIGRADVPKRVHDYITQEYTRTCLVAYESLPKHVFHEGWGRPGTKYEGIRFRSALLDTIPEIDALAHVIIPSHPPLKPHARMLQHFRFIIPLLPVNDDGLSLLHYYDSSIQLARNAGEDLDEKEFEVGLGAAEGIRRILFECRLEMEESSTQLDGSVSLESRQKANGERHW